MKVKYTGNMIKANGEWGKSSKVIEVTAADLRRAREYLKDQDSYTRMGLCNSLEMSKGVSIEQAQTFLRKALPLIGLKFEVYPGPPNDFDPMTGFLKALADPVSKKGRKQRLAIFNKLAKAVAKEEEANRVASRTQ